MRWIKRGGDDGAWELLARELGLHPVAARVLAARGVRDVTAAERFLRPRLTDLPDPSLMLGMSAAVERLLAALERRERVTVYGDYDVDGVTSTTLLVGFLRQVGWDADYYVPHRLVEGYGLNPLAVDRLAQAGTRLIVTVDCGVTAVEEVERAARAGVDVLVVDHHQAPAQLPRAVAMLNPHQPGCGFPSKELSAVGVTFMLLAGLRRRLRETGRFEGRAEPDLRQSLDLVALGTVADVVPLVGTNRIFVASGLPVLQRSARPGVRALLQVAGLAGAEAGPLTSGQVAFKLGPRINAAGRLDDAGTAVELLLCEEPERALRLAQQLDQANTERQQLERRITEEAARKAATRLGPTREGAPRGLVLWGEDWHPGVVGIVASRIVDRFHRPAVVIGLAGGVGKGSCRSVDRFNMYEGLGRCAEHLVRFGGHHHAAGVTIEPAALETFTRAFEQEASRQLVESDLEPSLRVDAEVHAHDAGMGLAESLGRLGPFGAGNPEPVLVSEVSGVEARVLVSRTGGADHLKFPIGGAEAIGFGMSEHRGVLRQRARVAYCLEVDHWGGRAKASARLKAVEERRTVAAPD